jgi:hypothetical protein
MREKSGEASEKQMFGDIALSYKVTLQQKGIDSLFSAQPIDFIRTAS